MNEIFSLRVKELLLNSGWTCISKHRTAGVIYTSLPQIVNDIFIEFGGLCIDKTEDIKYSWIRFFDAPYQLDNNIVDDYMKLHQIQLFAVATVQNPCVFLLSDNYGKMYLCNDIDDNLYKVANSNNEAIEKILTNLV